MRRLISCVRGLLFVARMDSSDDELGPSIFQQPKTKKTRGAFNFDNLIKQGEAKKKRCEDHRSPRPTLTLVPERLHRKIAGDHARQAGEMFY